MSTHPDRHPVRAAAALGAVLLASGLGGCSHQEKAPPSGRLVALRARPAVFKIDNWGDVEITYPSWIGLRTPFSFEGGTFRAVAPALVSEYEALGAAAGKSKAEYCWQRLADAPDLYLDDASPFTRMVKGANSPPLRDKVILQHVPGGSGSGFAVSGDGVILTNAHVIDSSSHLEDPAQRMYLGGLAFWHQPDGVLWGVKAQLENQLGAVPEGLREKALRSVHWWLTRRSTFTVKVAEVRVSMGQKKEVPWIDFSKYTDPANSAPGESALSKAAILEGTVQARVLSHGNLYPGKDVAVLKVDPGYELICLPLGDSDGVQPGDPVHALGFPGIAFEKDFMTRQAEYRFLYRNGAVGGRRPVQGGWDVLHLAANTYHGDSGGPVLDQQGRVIGLNVAILADPQEHVPVVPGMSHAIPINVAGEYLAAAGASAAPGPRTAAWEAGLEAFEQKRYDEALEQFGKATVGKPSADSPYDDPVGEMTRRAEAALREGGRTALVNSWRDVVGILILAAVILGAALVVVGHLSRKKRK
jgi:S1-C subfamily serine protease